jgi:hypothetical protein
MEKEGKSSCFQQVESELPVGCVGRSSWQVGLDLKRESDFRDELEVGKMELIVDCVEMDKLTQKCVV